MRGRILSALVAAPFALTLVLTGCGSDDSAGANVPTVDGSNNQAAAPKASADPHEQGLKFAQCMRENGIDMPDPEPGGGVTMRVDKNTPKDAMKAAQEACKQFAPSGQRQGGDPAKAESLRKAAECMRGNGVEDYPDPDNGAVRLTNEINQDPDFQAAQEKCQKLLAEAGMGGN